MNFIPFIFSKITQKRENTRYASLWKKMENSLDQRLNDCQTETNYFKLEIYNVYYFQMEVFNQSAVRIDAYFFASIKSRHFRNESRGSGDEYKRFQMKIFNINLYHCTRAPIWFINYFTFTRCPLCVRRINFIFRKEKWFKSSRTNNAIKSSEQNNTRTNLKWVRI